MFLRNITTHVRFLLVMLKVVGSIDVVLGLAAHQKSDDGWTSLFNGKDLDGWVQRGGKAKYRAEDGQIVGTSVPNTGNSFLCTNRDYAGLNGVLAAELKDSATASGFIALQVHGVGKKEEPLEVRFRNLRLKELK